MSIGVILGGGSSVSAWDHYRDLKSALVGSVPPASELSAAVSRSSQTEAANAVSGVRSEAPAAMPTLVAIRTSAAGGSESGGHQPTAQSSAGAGAEDQPSRAYALHTFSQWAVEGFPTPKVLTEAPNDKIDRIIAMTASPGGS